MWGASRAAAQYDMYIFPETATAYSGGCTAAGSANGHTVPRCVKSTYGEFQVAGAWMSAATGGSVKIKNIDFIKVNGTSPPVTTGNKCFRISCVVEVQGTTGASSFGSAITLTDDISAGGTNCVGTDGTWCSTGESATTTCAAGTGGDCTGTACNNHRVLFRVEHLTAAQGCSDALTDVDVSFIAAAVF